MYLRVYSTQVRCGRTPGAAAARYARYARYARSYVVEQVERAQGGRGHAAEQVNLPKAVGCCSLQAKTVEGNAHSAPRCTLYSSLARSRVSRGWWDLATRTRARCLCIPQFAVVSESLAFLKFAFVEFDMIHTWSCARSKCRVQAFRRARSM